MRLLFSLLGLFLFEFAPTWHLSANGFHQVARAKRQGGSNLGDNTETTTESSLTAVGNVKSSHGGHQKHHKITYEIGLPFGQVTTKDEFRMEGKKGYVYLANIFNSSYTTTYLYVKFDRLNAPYFYHFLEEPSNSTEFLAVANAEGHNGYRLKRQLFYATGNIDAYVRSAQRPHARYAYRHLPASQNPDDFLNLLNKQGEDGYRYWNRFSLGGLTSLFIKDKSQKSKFAYKMFPRESSSAEFLQHANDLGATGYRFLRNTFLPNPSYPLPAGSPLFWQFSLYSKALPNHSSKFSYAIPPNPVTFEEFNKQFKTQGKNGFLYLADQEYAEGGSVAIYMNIDKCHHCENLDLDGFF